MTTNTFAFRLADMGMAENTIKAYTQSVSYYFSSFNDVTFENIEKWKKQLKSSKAEKTVNLRVNALNKYVEVMGLDVKHCDNIREQKKTYVERVMSMTDYLYFKKRLLLDGKMTLYFAIWTMCSSGARVSELLKITVEDYMCGHYEVKSKGNKIRRIYLPRKLCEECLRWLASIKRTSGAVFLNRYGNVYDKSGLAKEIKKRAKMYGLNADEAHPHAFRHRFAISFLQKKNDLSLLADILGHSSIETTRIYVRQSADEQRQILDAIVNW